MRRGQLHLSTPCDSTCAALKTSCYASEASVRCSVYSAVAWPSSVRCITARAPFLQHAVPTIGVHNSAPACCFVNTFHHCCLRHWQAICSNDSRAAMKTLRPRQPHCTPPRHPPLPLPNSTCPRAAICERRCATFRLQQIAVQTTSAANVGTASKAVSFCS